LRQSTSVYENQRGAMLFDKFDQAVVNLVPHFVGGDGAELTGRNFNREIELALVADIHNDRIRPSVARKSSAGEEMRHFFDRLLRGRKSNTHRRTMCPRFQPLERKSQMRP